MVILSYDSVNSGIQFYHKSSNIWLSLFSLLLYTGVTVFVKPVNEESLAFQKTTSHNTYSGMPMQCLKSIYHKQPGMSHGVPEERLEKTVSLCDVSQCQ